jgi:hypothetical protein
MLPISQINEWKGHSPFASICDLCIFVCLAIFNCHSCRIFCPSIFCRFRIAQIAESIENIGWGISSLQSVILLFIKFIKELNCFCRSERHSEFNDIGDRCDSISVFHDFGHFLLRGHTLFTLFFLFISIAIFLATIFCHWRVNHQHEMLNANTRNGGRKR